MKKRTALLLVLVPAAVAFFMGERYELAKTSVYGHRAGKTVLYYVDPMDPRHTSDKPGIAPCGMNMEPVYGDDEKPKTSSDAAGPTLSGGSVKISPERQQMIGVRTDIVGIKAETRKIRTVGRVVADEARVYRLNAAVDGWIRETPNNSTGSFVKKGEVLASFYSTDVRTAQQTYIFGLSQIGRFQAPIVSKDAAGQLLPPAANTKQQADNLRSLGMSEAQLEELTRTRQFVESIKIISPVSGFILARNITPGLRFEKGTEWYRIADLSHVWVLADLFENEPYKLKAGARTTISLPGRSLLFTGIVSAVPPQFDPVSRTLKVRLDVDNPAFVLRPDMFVNVDFSVALPPAVTVPSEAVLDTGLKKTVFIDKGGGLFESPGS